MKIRVKVHPRAKHDLVKPNLMGGFEVYTKAPRDKNRANEAVVGLLAGYFATNKSSIRLVSGRTSKNKVFEVLK